MNARERNLKYPHLRAKQLAEDKARRDTQRANREALQAQLRAKGRVIPRDKQAIEDAIQRAKDVEQKQKISSVTAW